MTAPLPPVPGAVARVAGLMSTFRPWWSLCGGWAVDAWLGRQTRDHGDVDIAVFQDDHRALFNHLAGWQVIAHDPNVAGDTSEPWDGRPLDLPAHVHARLSDGRGSLPDRLDAPAQLGFGLDIQISEGTGGDWVLSPEPRVALPLDQCARQSAWGAPTAVPKVLLFYKATAYNDLRPHDELDFLALLPHLTGDERKWLREAVSLVHPGHPWLAHLSR